MEMHLLSSGFCMIILTISIGGASCTADLTQVNENQHESGDKPLWVVRLPGNAGIYNDGLIGLPVIGEKVVFHSTIQTSKQYEDNRLHAIDIRSGELIWTFPKTFNPLDSYFFEGKPYVFGNLLVTKMGAFSPYCDHDRILVLDLSPGIQRNLIHLSPELSNYATRDMAGDGTTAWFVQESKHSTLIYSINLNTADTVRIANLISSHSEGRVELSSRELNSYSYKGTTHLLLALSEYWPDTTLLYAVLVDVSTGKLSYKHSLKGDLNFPVNNILLNDSLLFYTSGRMASCVNIFDNKVYWQYFNPGPVDSMMPGLLVQNNTLFIWGHTGSMAFEAKTGKKLYANDIECANVNGKSPLIVALCHNGKVSVLDEESGNVLKTISIPFSRDETSGFSYGCKPGISEGKIFLFGTHHAYCYEYN